MAGFIGTPGLNLISGTVDSAKGVVAVADGQQLAYDRRRWPSVGDGPVTVGFRAEVVRIGGARNVLKGEFDFAEEMGAARLLHGTFGGETVVANVADVVRRAAGDALHISVDPADIQFFDSESGRRLPYEVLWGAQSAPAPVESAAN